MEHKKTYRLVRGEVPEEEYTLPIGVADVKRTGGDITAVSYGLTLHYCLEAAQQVASEGIDVEVVDLRTLTPLDKDTVLESVRKTGKLLIAHEDNVTGGVGAEIAAIAAAEAFEYLDGPHIPGLRPGRAYHALRSEPGRSLYARHRKDRAGLAQACGFTEEWTVPPWL